MTLGVLPNLSELVSLSVNRDNCGIELWGSLCTRAAWRLACGGCLTAASVRPGTWLHCTSGRSGQERAASTPQPLSFLLALLPLPLPRAGTCPRGKAGSGWDGPTPAFPSRTCSEAQLRLGPSTRPDRPVSLSSAGATPAPDRSTWCVAAPPPGPAFTGSSDAFLVPRGLCARAGVGGGCTRHVFLCSLLCVFTRPPRELTAR